VNHVEVSYLEHAFINFEDGTYRWIDTKHFSFFPADSSDAAVLSALVAHPRYRDTYISPDSHAIESHGVHGPFLVDRIAPSSFLRLDAQQAQATLEEFCSLDGHLPPPDIRERIAHDISDTFQPASSIYRLGEVADASHDCTGILWEFRELVVISAERCRLSLHVTAID